MSPIAFEGQNTTYVAEDCGDLPARIDGEGIWSCWQPTTEELADLAAGSPVWLCVVAEVQPPVRLGLHGPAPYIALRDFEGDVVATRVDTAGSREVGRIPREKLGAMTAGERQAWLDDLRSYLVPGC